MACLCCCLLPLLPAGLSTLLPAHVLYCRSKLRPCRNWGALAPTATAPTSNPPHQPPPCGHCRRAQELERKSDAFNAERRKATDTILDLQRRLAEAESTAQRLQAEHARLADKLEAQQRAAEASAAAAGLSARCLQRGEAGSMRLVVCGLDAVASLLTLTKGMS